MQEHTLTENKNFNQISNNLINIFILVREFYINGGLYAI